VVKFSPLIAANAQARKKPTAVSWRMDETYIKVRGKWTYLYALLIETGNLLVPCFQSAVIPPPREGFSNTQLV
jgi:transposase-like protein